MIVRRGCAVETAGILELSERQLCGIVQIAWRIYDRTGNINLRRGSSSTLTPLVNLQYDACTFNNNTDARVGSGVVDVIHGRLLWIVSDRSVIVNYVMLPV